MDQIAYKSGYKYQLVQEYIVSLPELASSTREDIVTPYIVLYANGDLVIRVWYAWDGATGAIDFMRPSLVHDALYQLMREGHLDPYRDRETADIILRRLYIEDRDFVINASDSWDWVKATRKKAARVRAGYIYFAVRQFAEGAATEEPKEIQYAPWSHP